MSRLLVVMALPLLMAACSFSSSRPREPNATVVIPPGSTVICSDGSQPPCN